MADKPAASDDPRLYRSTDEVISGYAALDRVATNYRTWAESALLALPAMLARAMVAEGIPGGDARAAATACRQAFRRVDEAIIELGQAADQAQVIVHARVVEPVTEARARARRSGGDTITVN